MTCGIFTGNRLVYAIGDMHGRADLLAAMLHEIEQDAEQMRGRFNEPPVVVFLGDYVDRGRMSREVIELCLDFSNKDRFEARFLLGNHEEAMLDFLDHRTQGVGWCSRGGRATLESYGVKAPFSKDDREGWANARSALRANLPPAHERFLRSLEWTVEYGELLFVHAGIRPGIGLAEQDRTDLLWIRSEFLNHDQPYGHVVVHGHTPLERAYVGPNRISLDTGAYASGLLSGARFDGGTPHIFEVRQGLQRA